MKILFTFILCLLPSLVFAVPMVRVCENVDGTVRVINPNRSLQLPAESDADFMIRTGDMTIAGDSSLQGLSCFDVVKTSLPVRKRNDSQGDSENVRNGWRKQGNAVVIDNPSVSSNYMGVTPRLNIAISSNSRAVHAGLFEMLKTALGRQDIPLIQSVYDQLQASTTLTTGEKNIIRSTMQTKKIGITL